MRFWLSKNRITAIVLSAAVMLTSLTGCGARKGYDAPELIAPVSVSRIFRNPEMRDLKDVKYYEGVVVPTTYPVFYDKFMTVKEVKVKIGDYVEEGDVIAVGESVSQGMGYSEGTDGSEGVGIQRKIDDLLIELQNYNRMEAVENGDEEGVKRADTNIALAVEDKRYNDEVASYEAAKSKAEKDKYSASQGNATLVADHSGYITFLKDISVNDVAKPYENVVVISDMDDLYIECSNVNATKNRVKDYEEHYTYIDGEKVDITEIEYSQQVLSLAEVTGNPLPLRYRVSRELKAGDNYLLVFKDTIAENVLTVGAGAVTYHGMNKYVYVRKEGEDVEKRNVEVGHTDGKYVEITYGLTLEDDICYPLGEYYPQYYKEVEVGTGDVSKEQTSSFILGKNSHVKGYYNDFPGKIEEVNVKMNQEVKKGDLLFSYATENGRAKLGELEQNIITLKKNHNDTIKMFNDMKNPEEPEETPAPEPEVIKDTQIGTATATDASATDAYKYIIPTAPAAPEITDIPETPQYIPRYVEEKKNLNLTIIDYRIQLENLTFNTSLARLEKQYSAISENNNGDGVISVYAESDGIVKNIDKDAFSGSVYKSRSHILSVVEEGVDETLVQMREMKTSQFGGGDDSDPSAPFKSAQLGRELEITIEDKTFGGRCIGVNGAEKSVYLAERAGNPVFTTCTAGAEYRDQFYAEFDEEIDYEKALKEKSDVLVKFKSTELKGVPVLDKGVIYSEYNENKPIDYVWVLENGTLTKRYIQAIPSGDVYIIIDGVEIGDKIIRETTTVVED